MRGRRAGTPSSCCPLRVDHHVDHHHHHHHHHLLHHHPCYKHFLLPSIIHLHLHHYHDDDSVKRRCDSVRSCWCAGAREDRLICSINVFVPRAKGRFHTPSPPPNQNVNGCVNSFYKKNDPSPQRTLKWLNQVMV